MESKKDIRKRVLIDRNQLSEKDWAEKSERIYEKVTTNPFFLHAKEIYCYIDFRKEVGTKKIIKAAWELGKKVAVPKIIGDYMEFYYIESFKELMPGNWGILEPENQNKALGSNVLVIMPGAVFDKKRHRIGYGKGYYDKYLVEHLDYQTMALAFELQMLENIPADAHDICPQIIVTEEQTYA